MEKECLSKQYLKNNIFVINTNILNKKYLNNVKFDQDFGNIKEVRTRQQNIYLLVGFG